MGDQTTTPKKAKAAAAGGKVKKAVAKPAHPKSGEMVLEAVTALKERKGSSLAAIKKYIASTYKVDSVKKAVFIRKALKKAVADGSLVQIKGSFKLPTTEKKESKSKPKTAAAGPGKKLGRPKKKSAEGKKAATTPKKKKKATTPKKKATTPKKAAAAGSTKKPKAKSTSGKKPGRPKKN